MSLRIPEELKYAKTHEWVRVEGGRATVGISDYAQQELTDIVFVEVPPVGRRLKSGEACAVVESVKAASDIYAPISGEVVAVNAELARHPELVNSDPYGAGWFFEVKLSEPKELDQLLSAANYRSQIGA